MGCHGLGHGGWGGRTNFEGKERDGRDDRTDRKLLTLVAKSTRKETPVICVSLERQARMLSEIINRCTKMRLAERGSRAS